MNAILRLLAVIAICAMLCGSFTGCNLIEGFGKDMEKGGEELQDAADDAKD